MSLSQIATDMKTVARRTGAARRTMPNGAALILTHKTNPQFEFFDLQVTRRGKLPAPGTRGAKAWATELSTFAKYFVPVGTTQSRVDDKPTETSYSAHISWNEYPDAAPVKHEISLPRTPEEIAAWARTLGPGIKIRNVNVFTGEL
jgi:hypothetical protein